MKGSKFILLGLYAFLGLCFELVFAYILEPLIYGVETSKWNDLQYIIHWGITCIAWALVAFLIVRTSKYKYSFDVFKSKGKIKIWQWVIVIICMIFVLSIRYFDWNGMKIIRDFQNFGVMKFTFQYLYYFFEIILVTIIIVFAQKAFEIWFEKEGFPFGGIILALSWGLVHIFTKGLFIGIVSLVVGFIFGSIYLLVNRDIKITVTILFIMFIL